MQPIASGERVPWLKALFPFLNLTNLSASLTTPLPGPKVIAAAILAGLGLAPPTCYELTNPPAPSTTALLAATATVNGTQTVLGSALTAVGGTAELALRPRNLEFTTGGATAAHAPNQVVITGTDIDGNALTETLALSQVNGTDVGVKAFATVSSLVYTGGTNTDATVAVGIGQKFGLPLSIKSRAGRLSVIQEVAVGAVVTTGTFVSPATSGPHGTYSPATAPDATKSYAVTFEFVVP